MENGEKMGEGGGGRGRLDPTLGIIVRRNDSVATPDYMLDDIRSEFGEFFDPCPFDPEFKVDGLKLEDWGETTFVNPPYSDIKPWIEKGLEEAGKGRTIVFLIPVRTNSAYWQKLVLPYADEIRFLDKCIEFKGYKKTCPFGLCLVVFRSSRKKLTPTIKRHHESLIRKRTKAHYQFYSWQRQTRPSSPLRSTPPPPTTPPTS